MTLKSTQDRAEQRIQTQANEQVSRALATEGGSAGARPALVSWGEAGRGEAKAAGGGAQQPSNLALSPGPPR